MDEWDAYFWPNSNVLKNKAGLTHAAALRSFEYEATRQRAEILRRFPCRDASIPPTTVPSIGTSFRMSMTGPASTARWSSRKEVPPLHR